MRSARSKTVTWWPAMFNSAAQARPAGPEPTTATFCPCGNWAGFATTQPSAKARSAIAHSLTLMVTGGALMPSTHDPSQGAGHTRPVTSGKLLVRCKTIDGLRASGPCRQDRSTRESGWCNGQPLARPSMILPVWQKGNAAVHANARPARAWWLPVSVCETRQNRRLARAADDLRGRCD